MSASTPKLLVPVDGSESAMRALRYAIDRARPMGAEIHVLHVEAPIPAAVTDFVGAKAVHGFHAEEAEKVLGPARALLTKAGVVHEAAWKAGPASETIAAYCREKHCTEIVMGCRGLGRISGLLLGSVTTQVLSLAEVPVTLVK